MDRYGDSARDVGSGSKPDPSPEWTDSGPETGLEESVWHLGLAEMDPTTVGTGYPERPDEPDCIYYLRTGFCGYGARCRFNHPRDRGAGLGVARVGGGEFPERVGQPVCQYYMRTGTCKYGASCKYHHPRNAVGSGSVVPLNYYGYPLRPGEKECTYYMKTGECKFGSTCKFHHPQPTNIQIPTQPPAPQVAHVPAAVQAPPTMYPPVQSPSDPSQQYGFVVARPPMLPGYVPGPYGPMLVSAGVVSYPNWTPYPAPVSSVASSVIQSGVGAGSIYGMGQLSPSAVAYTGTYQPMPASIGPSSSSVKESQFPERPDQPECQYYLKTGDCKFGASCRYHHPPELAAQKPSVVLSPMGLPLNPGAPVCTHYTQRGRCKFGSVCKFDHPMGPLTYSPSASSLVDMPVAPYPVGSSIGHLAPSSSSSDLRPELISGSSKDSGSTRMSSSMSTSSGSISSITSKSGPGAQQSGQSSGLSVSGSGSTKDARTSS